MRLRLALASIALISSFTAAHADTISIFNLSGTASSGTLSGTITLNATTGRFTDSAIRFLYTGVTFGGLVTGTAYNFTGTPINTSTGTGYSSNDFAGTGSGSPFDFDLSLPSTSLIGYTGGALCSTTRTCGSQVSAVEVLSSGVDFSQVTSGTLTLVPPAAVTPEPSALLLLGTGVLGLGVLLRKRPN